MGIYYKEANVTQQTKGGDWKDLAKCSLLGFLIVAVAGGIWQWQQGATEVVSTVPATNNNPAAPVQSAPVVKQPAAPAAAPVKVQPVAPPVDNAVAPASSEGVTQPTTQLVKSVPIPGLTELTRRLNGQTSEQDPEGEVKAITYDVKVAPTDKGVSVVFDRAQLWRTNWASTIIDAEPSLAMKDGKVVGIQLNHVGDGLLSAVGLKSGDTVKKINNADLNNPLTMPATIARGLGGARATIMVEREGIDVPIEVSSENTVDKSLSPEEKAHALAQYRSFTQSASKLLLPGASAAPAGSTEPATDGNPMAQLEHAEKQFATVGSSPEASKDPLVKALVNYGSSMLSEARYNSAGN